MSNVCIEIKDVHKSFGKTTALDGLNLTVEEGQIFALLGHNGAGKTTTLRAILGLIDVNQGEIKVFGENPIKSNEKLAMKAGVLSEDVGLYESLTVYDNLKFFAEIYKCSKQEYESRIDKLLNEFEIYQQKFSVIKDFSLGMKKKVALIRTILHQPKLVLLDEPTNGLDPISIQKFHAIMQKMSIENQTTFVLTTHNLDEVKKICQRFAIVRHGKNIFNKSLDENSVTDICETKIFCLESVENQYQNIAAILKKISIDLEFHLKDNTVVLKTIDKAFVAQTIKALCTINILPYEIKKDEFNLEKIYLQTEAGEAICQ
jgi:ABC-2 type transport system ATP-binding protein